MLKIYVIRHGETALNTSNVFRGRLEVELSEKGLKQADLLGQSLKGIKIDKLYSGPLKRAYQTAEAIARHNNLTVEVTQGLMDLDFGDWEGLSSKVVQEKYRDIYDTWLKKPHLAQIPGGERLEDVSRRAVPALQEIMTDNPKGSVVLVTHRVVTKILICHMLGLDISHFWLIEHDTCGITQFYHDGSNFFLKKHNDTCFLAQMK
jgi:phosphoserine phosphatase